MPETPLDDTLQRILAYPEKPVAEDADSFVVGVMGRVRRERRRRRLILGIFGGIGALFGLAGAALLAGPIEQLATVALDSTILMQGALVACGAIAFYVWVMGDDLTLTR